MLKRGGRCCIFHVEQQFVSLRYEDLQGGHFEPVLAPHASSAHLVSPAQCVVIGVEDPWRTEVIQIVFLDMPGILSHIGETGSQVVCVELLAVHSHRQEVILHDLVSLQLLTCPLVVEQDELRDGLDHDRHTQVIRLVSQ